MAIGYKCLCQAFWSGPVDVLIESRKISLQNGPETHKYLEQLNIRTQADNLRNAVHSQKL